MGWVRIRILVSGVGGRLDDIARVVRVRRARAVPGGVELDVREGDLLRLRAALRGSGARVRVVKRYGALRARAWARGHAALLAVGVLALVLLYGASNLVLRVTVTGEKDASQERQMKALLEEMGLRPGVWAPGVDRDGIAQAVKREFSGLVYAGVRRSGFGAMELYVVQATPAPEVYDDRARVDVVASFGGLVTRVVTLSGEALVQPGDTVVPGQVLIRGTEAAPHAGGEVTARVWAQGVGDAALFSEEAEDTGRQVVETFLEVNGARFPAALEIPFSTYRVEEEAQELLGGLFYPARLVRRTVLETEESLARRDPRAVREEAGDRALRAALEGLPGNATLVDKRVEYSMIESGKLRATATLEAVMQIGREAEAAAP